ncbi:HemK family protein methyltransferase [Candidatus Saccharibacteria bacterium]|nr:HemK family protein methyltransferase [Candidatus Saccharibacteria bacterium]
MNNLPKAYQDGHQDFYGRNFIVSPAVLIPRPETEALVDEVLNLAGKPFLPGIKPPDRKLSERPLILDVGTGSGILAITLKLELPEATVLGLDLSEAALEVAKANAKILQADVQFARSDLIKNYAGEEPEVVVANLPSVDPSWEWLDKETLAAEPEIALYAEDGGLALIKRLLQEIKSKNWRSKIVLELDPSEQETLQTFAKSLGFYPEKATGFELTLSSTRPF